MSSSSNSAKGEDRSLEASAARVEPTGEWDEYMNSPVAHRRLDAVWLSRARTTAEARLLGVGAALGRQRSWSERSVAWLPWLLAAAGWLAVSALALFERSATRAEAPFAGDPQRFEVAQRLSAIPYPMWRDRLFPARRSDRPSILGAGDQGLLLDAAEELERAAEAYERGLAREGERALRDVQAKLEQIDAEGDPELTRLLFGLADLGTEHGALPDPLAVWKRVERNLAKARQFARDGEEYLVALDRLSDLEPEGDWAERAYEQLESGPVGDDPILLVLELKLARSRRLDGDPYEAIRCATSVIEALERGTVEDASPLRAWALAELEAASRDLRE